MLVRIVSARNPHGVRPESMRCPLYPTRPDPTRPVKNPCGHLKRQAMLSYRARSATLDSWGASR